MKYLKLEVNKLDKYMLIGMYIAATADVAMAIGVWVLVSILMG